MMSIYIPCIFNHSEKYIQELCEKELGKVSRIEIVQNKAYVYFEYWYETEKSIIMRKKLEAGIVLKLYTESKPIQMLKNRSNKLQATGVEYTKIEKCGLEGWKKLSIIHPDKLNNGFTRSPSIIKRNVELDNYTHKLEEEIHDLRAALEKAEIRILKDAEIMDDMSKKIEVLENIIHDSNLDYMSSPTLSRSDNTPSDVDDSSPLTMMELEV
jgi:hypothetical protein